MKITVTNWEHKEWPPPIGSLWRGVGNNTVYMCTQQSGAVATFCKIPNGVSFTVREDVLGTYTRLSRVVLEEGPDSVTRQVPS